jgi:DNA-binding IclR family transcriptional regulator
VQGAEGMAILAGNPPAPGERPEVTAGRERGYVISAGEILPGTWGLAAPVPSAAGRSEMSVGVISAQALDEQSTASAVLEATTEISRRLDSELS